MSNQIPRAADWRRVLRVIACAVALGLATLGLPGIFGPPSASSQTSTPFTIRGFVYRDDNGNGVRNIAFGDSFEAEPGLPNIEVRVTNVYEGFEVVTGGFTDVAGTFEIQTEFNSLNSRYRIEVLDPEARYTDSVLTGFNATTVQFLNRGGNTRTVGQALDVGMVDRAFFGEPATSCFDSLLTSSGTTTHQQEDIYAFGPPDSTSGLGAPLAAPWQETNSVEQPTIDDPSFEPAGLTVGPDGDIWAGSQGDQYVRRFSSTGDFKAKYTSQNPALSTAIGLRFGPDGLLYVADNSFHGLSGSGVERNRILTFDPTTQVWDVFTKSDDQGVSAFNYTPAGDANPIHPRPHIGMAFRNDGYLYVAADKEASAVASSRILQLRGPSMEDPGTRTGKEWLLPDRVRGIEIGPDNFVYAIASSNTTGGVYKIDVGAGPNDNGFSTKVIDSAAASHASFGPDGDIYLVNGHGNGGSNQRRGMVIRYNGPLKATPFAETPHPIYISNSAVIGAPDGYTQVAPRMLVWQLKADQCPSLQVPVDIGSRVWNDEDEDGLQDADEPGVSAVTVSAFKPGASSPFGTDTTDENGNWNITVMDDPIIAGEYEIEFSGPILEVENDATATLITQGNNPLLDSNVVTNPTTSEHTITFTMDPSGASPEMHSLDAGFSLPNLSVGGNLFKDSANDGLSSGDPSLHLWPIEVWNADSNQKYASVYTDFAGFYEVGGLHGGGNYIVRVPNSHTENRYRSSSGDPTSPLSGDYEPAPDPDNNADGVDDGTYFSDPAYIQTSAVTLSEGAEPTNDGDTDANTNLTIDLGFVPLSGVGDRIWCDDDEDGIYSSEEPAPQTSITVNLLNQANAIISTTTSLSDGSYNFNPVTPGTYQIQFEIDPALYSVTLLDQGGDDTDNDANSLGVTGEFTTTSNYPTDLTRDLGLICTSVGGTVFDDKDDNGIQGGGEETGLAGMTVELFDSGGGLIDSAISSSNGTYGFTGLAAGDYTVEIPWSELYSDSAVGFVSSVGWHADPVGSAFEPAADPDEPSTDSDDSGATNWTSGNTTSLPVTVVAGTPRTDIDFGFYDPDPDAAGVAYVTTFAGNGTASNGDPGAGGVPTAVAVKNPSGIAVASDGSVYTSNGNYIYEVKDGTIRRLATINSAYNFGSTYLAIYGDYLYMTVSSTTFSACRINRVDLSLSTYPRTLELWSGTGSCVAASDTPSAVSGRSWHTLGGIAFDSAGNAYVSEISSGKIRKIDGATGIVSTLVSGLTSPGHIAIEPKNDTDLYVIENGGSNNIKRVLKYDLTNSPPTATVLYTVTNLYASGFGLAVRSGALYYSRYFWGDIQRYNAGVWSSYAGTFNSRGFSGDGGPAASAQFGYLGQIAFGPDGALYVADNGNSRIRRIYFP